MQIRDKYARRRFLLVLALVCAFLEIGVAPNIQIMSGSINFALIFASVVALMFGGPIGVVSGFLAGFFFDLSTTGPIGLMALLLSISSYILGIEVRNRLVEDTQAAIKNAAIAIVAVSLLYSLLMLASGNTASFADALLLRALPTSAATFIVFIPFAVALSRKGSRGPDLSGARAGKRLG